jgi:hypothetical protein
MGPKGKPVEEEKPEEEVSYNNIIFEINQIFDNRKYQRYLSRDSVNLSM